MRKKVCINWNIVVLKKGAATRLSGGTGKYLSILQWKTSLSSTNVVKCAWKFIQLVLLPWLCCCLSSSSVCLLHLHIIYYLFTILCTHTNTHTHRESCVYDFHLCLFLSLCVLSLCVCVCVIVCVPPQPPSPCSVYFISYSLEFHFALFTKGRGAGGNGARKKKNMLRTKKWKPHRRQRFNYRKFLCTALLISLAHPAECCLSLPSSLPPSLPARHL